MLLIRLALRNLWRNKRRSIITAIGISGGLAMLIFSSGFADGAHGQMIEAGIRAMAGHVVVQGEDWQKKREIDIVVPDSDGVVQVLEREFPEATVLKRVFLQGLLTSPSGSAGVGLVAVQPDREARINDLDDKLIDGEYLDGQVNGIYLGKALAKTLDVGVGDKVVLMAQHQGDIESQLFRVCGLFETGIVEIDGFTGQIQIEAAQDLLGLGTDATQVAAHLGTYHDTGPATLQAKAALADREGIEVLTWYQALPEIYEFVILDEGGMYVLLLVLIFIVALGILNTMLMSVLERIREFGVMLSLGATPGRLATLVMTEATLLGLFSVGVGLVLGLVFNASWAGSGLDMAAMMGEDTANMEMVGVAMDWHIYPDLSAAKTMVFVFLTFGMTVVSAIYPALKAATLKPIECLQHR